MSGRPRARRTGAHQDRKSRDAARQRLQAAATGARDVIDQRAATLRRLARWRGRATYRRTSALHRLANRFVVSSAVQLFFKKYFCITSLYFYTVYCKLRLQTRLKELMNFKLIVSSYRYATFIISIPCSTCRPIIRSSEEICL